MLKKEIFCLEHDRNLANSHKKLRVGNLQTQMQNYGIFPLGFSSLDTHQSQTWGPHPRNGWERCGGGEEP